MAIRILLTNQTSVGATAQLSPVAWQQIVAKLPLVNPTVPITVRTQLAARIASALTDGAVVRIELSAAELALVQAAAEGA